SPPLLVHAAPSGQDPAALGTATGVARLYDPLVPGHRLRHGAVVLPGQRLPRVPRGRPVEIDQSPVATRLRPLRHIASAPSVRARFLAATASPLPASDELFCPRGGAAGPDVTALPPGPSWQVVRPVVPAGFPCGHSSDPAPALRQPRFAGNV